MAVAVHHDVSPPLRSIRPIVGPKGIKAPHEADEGLPEPKPSNQPDPVVQTRAGNGQIPSTSVSFEGLAAGQAGYAYVPPDANGAAGPSQYFEIANAEIAIYSKSGSRVWPVSQPAATTNTLWSGFGGGCEANDDGDGTVVYDQLAGRWVVQQFSISTTPYLECVAVSTTGDPTGSYYRYSFSYGNTNFNDYPKLGVWPDGYYTAYNIFANGQTFAGPEVCAFDRARMLSGQAATQQCFQLSTSYGSLLPSSVDGSTAPPAGSPNFLLSFGSSTLQLWKFHVDWTNSANSTLTGPTSISVASFSPACGGGRCIPQSGTSQQLDSLADRLMYRVGYRNFGDHESLVVDHAVAANGAVGMRWYELRSPNGSPTVYQQGTYAPDGSYRWMGSVAMDHVGDMAMGYSISSSTLHPAIGYTGRLAGDPLGQMPQGEGTIFAGAGSQMSNLYAYRWGDYTSVAIDPADDCTFWYVNEYIPSNGTFNWHTRIAAFKFPSCPGGAGSPPTVTSFTPTSGSVGTQVDVQGANFTGATSVTFNGAPDPNFVVNSSTDITAHVPAGATTGPIAVTTSSGTGPSSTSFTVTGAGTPPVVTSFSPTSGPEGTVVDVLGSNFTGATGVTFNGTAASFTFNSDSELHTTVPPGAASGPISVTTLSGTGTSSTSFNVTGGGGGPAVTSFTPASGPVGTSVSISGSGFTGANAVTFNTTDAVSYTVNSDTSITATVPAGATTGLITVTTAGGSGSSVTPFTVTTSTGKPVISSFSPTSGRRGSTVTINGRNFASATWVRLGTFAAAFTVVSDTKITAVVPSSARVSGFYKWSVTNPAGTGTSLSYYRVTG